MQLEGAKAELRSRAPFEAADLGVLLLRALFVPALKAWLGFVLPLQLAVMVACWSLSWGWSIFCLWWLKPVYDRAWGLVLGCGLFGDPPSGRTLYRALWSDGRRGLFGDLSWRRLDPARTLVIFVTLLEGLKGKAAARRRRTLGESTTVTAGLVLAACLALELAMTAGWILGMRALLPDEAAWIAQELWPGDIVAIQERSILAAYAASLGIVEPLFVAAGFGLYVNRRTNIEGWDVELTFRRMSRRLMSKGKVALAALLVLACVSPSLLAAGTVVAQEDSETESTSSAVDESLRLPAPEVQTDNAAADAMARVLARPELQRSHFEEHWEFRSDQKLDDVPRSSSPWLESLAGLMARGLEILLYALTVLALAVGVAVVVQRTQAFRPLRVAPTPMPEFVALLRGTDASSPVLAPHEVVPRARALLNEGQDVAALSVLYVGTLTALMQQHDVALPPQATEEQCLVAVRAAPIAEDRRSLFVELTTLWQTSAYAHTQPERARLEDLCARFTVYFGRAA